jgi:hypothetical protein
MNNTIKVILSSPSSDPFNLFSPEPSNSPTPFFNPLSPITGSLKEWAKDQTTDVIKGILESIRDVFVDSSYSVALVGGGICILLWMGGWDNGKKWAGILLMSHVLIRFLLGGI